MGKTKIKTIDDSVDREKTIEDGKTKMEEEVRPQPSIIKKPSSTIHRPSSKKIRSKKYQQVINDLDRTKSYPLEEAVDMIKKMSYSKFNATLEAHINTTQIGLRGFASLPYASGRKTGKTEYKTEAKAPIIHMALGKLNQSNEELISNIKTLLTTLGKSKIKKVSLAPTMGPSVKLDLASLS